MIITLKNCIIPECVRADHKWEFERPTLRELKRVEQTTGMDVEVFFQGMGDVETTGMTSRGLDAVLALVDILHRRDGLRIAFEDIDVDFPSLNIEFQPGETDEDEGEEPADGAGKDPAPTSRSLPPGEPDNAPASGSGRGRKAGSKPRSSATARSSGGSSA